VDGAAEGVLEGRDTVGFELGFEVVGLFDG